MPISLPLNALRRFLLFASAAIVLYLLFWLQPVLIPPALAVLLTFVLGPMVTVLHRHRGAAHVRLSCMRVHSRFPDLKILVSRWGVDEPDDRTRDQLIAAGAYLVATTLAETRDQVATLAGLATRESQLAPDGGTAVPEPQVAAA